MKLFSQDQQACRGMTLIEVLLVSAILGIVVMAVMSLFIPAVQSTAVQTELSDVQSNLRLAMNRMTDDLLTAGFLMGAGNPIIFQASITPTTAENPDDDDFTIQTRTVSNTFARVQSVSSQDLVLTDADMVDLFPAGSKIRFFNPILATEVGSTPRTVNAIEKASRILTISEGITDIEPDTVIARVKAGAPSIQTIRYRLNNGVLIRSVNNDDQFLARGISAVAFDYEKTPGGKVHKVGITLTGQTQNRGNNVLAEAKSRELKTSVTLRNVF